MRLDIAINKGCEKLKKSKTNSAMLDSELLLSKVIKKSREFIILNSKQRINEKDYNHFQELINQRSKGKPIAYLIGKKPFWKYEFKVNDKGFDQTNEGTWSMQLQEVLDKEHFMPWSKYTDGGDKPVK